MSILNIVTHPSYFLRTKSSVVKKKYIPTGEFQKLVDDMLETMKHAQGAGLAAPQVGKSLRIIIATDKGKPFIFINPKLYRKSFKKVKAEEGCLSVPGVWGTVKRHAAVSLVALDREGSKVKLRATDMFAVVLQHEVDHLNGILFIDKAKKIGKPPQL